MRFNSVFIFFMLANNISFIKRNSCGKINLQGVDSMRILTLGERLEEISEEDFRETDKSVVFITTPHEARTALKLAGVRYEGIGRLSEIEFNRVETQLECLSGTLYIPKHSNVLGSRYHIIFMINSKHIVIIDETDFTVQTINRISRRRLQQGETREHFIYNYFTQFMAKDLEILGRYEQRLMRLEERVRKEDVDDFNSEIIPIRKELLELRTYYDEIMDIGKALEENENGFFNHKQLRFFGTISDRADRLMNRTSHLLEYAQQVRDTYQTLVDAEQNKNMEYLTVVSTIFYPLTLITSWYGMNFKNMPELDHGYPVMIAVSALIMGFTIYVFKKKKMLWQTFLFFITKIFTKLKFYHFYFVK